MKILCFGIAKEIVGKEVLELTNDIPHTVKELREWVVQTYPKMKGVKSFMVAVNQEYATEELKINQTDEIAIIPPVSGG